MRQMTLDEFIPMGDDPLLREVARYIVTTGKVSIGSVMRHFRLGFKRADRIMSQLADKGVIGRDYKATNPKAPIMTEEGLKEWMMSE